MTQRYAVNARAFLPTMPEAATCVVTPGNVAFVRMREAEMLDILALSAGLILLGLLLVLGLLMVVGVILSTIRSSQISRLEERQRDRNERR